MNENMKKNFETLGNRIIELEKDLEYYRKTSREYLEELEKANKKIEELEF